MADWDQNLSILTSSTSFFQRLSLHLGNRLSIHSSHLISAICLCNPGGMGPTAKSAQCKSTEPLYLSSQISLIYSSSTFSSPRHFSLFSAQTPTPLLQQISQDHTGYQGETQVECRYLILPPLHSQIITGQEIHTHLNYWNVSTLPAFQSSPKIVGRAKPPIQGQRFTIERKIH